MKILHVFDSFSPSRGGGTVTLLYKLARAQAQRGHNITVYTTDFELDQQFIDSIPEINVHSFHCVSQIGMFYITPGIIKAARENLRHFDVIHLHCVRSFQNIIICHYARKYGIPYIVDQHGSLPRSHGKKTPKWLLRWVFDILFGYRILRNASGLIGETEVGVNEFKPFGIDPEKIALITPPFPIEEFAVLPARGQFRARYGLNNKKIALFLGRINWIKGLDFLVNSFSKLTTEMDDAVLVIVGSDDGFKNALVEQIISLGITNKVLFTGFLGGEDKLSALVDADVVIQTSRYEQGAWAPFEAVLCSTPIIVSGNSGAGEDVRKVNAGYLVDYGDEDGLSNMIKYVFNNTPEAKAKTLRAKEYIETNLSMDKGAEKYEALYENSVRAVKALNSKLK